MMTMKAELDHLSEWLISLKKKTQKNLHIDNDSLPIRKDKWDPTQCRWITKRKNEQPGVWRADKP